MFKKYDFYDLIYLLKIWIYPKNKNNNNLNLKSFNQIILIFLKH